jgi:hypothetical protein
MVVVVVLDVVDVVLWEWDVVVVFVVVVTFVQALSPLRRDAFLETPSLRVFAVSLMARLL